MCRLLEAVVGALLIGERKWGGRSGDVCTKSRRRLRGQRGETGDPHPVGAEASARNSELSLERHPLIAYGVPAGDVGMYVHFIRDPNVFDHENTTSYLSLRDANGQFHAVNPTMAREKLRRPACRASLRTHGVA